MRIDSIKIKPRLIGAFMIVALIAALIGWKGLGGLAVMKGSQDEIGVVRLPSVESLLIISEAQTAVDSAENALLCRSLTPEIRRAQYQRFDDAEKRYKDAWAIYEPLPQTKKEAGLWKEFTPAWETWWKDHEEYVRLSRAYERSSTDANYAKMVDQALVTIGESFGASESLLVQIIDLNSDIASASVESANASYASTKKMMMVFMAIGIVIAVILGVVIALSVANPVKKLADIATQLGAGDMGVEIDAEAKDEIGDLSRSMDGMASTLRTLIEEDGGQALQAAADKDLTARVTSDYQGAFDVMKQNINSLLERMDAAMSQVAESANTVAASSQSLSATAQEVGKGSQQIAETSQQLATGAQEQSSTSQASSQAMEQLGKAIDEVASGAQQQAKNVDETVTVVEQITSAIEQVGKLAQEAAATGQQVSEVANDGGNQVQEAVAALDKIQESSAKVGEMVNQLGESSQQIGAIVETIDDIAEQTNLLALNAAIEAARAGEHGKGFAVVADEVRKLAERSSKATGEIAELISGIKTVTDQAVAAMEVGTTEVENGTALGRKAGEALGEIQKAIGGVLTQIEDMSAAAQQMTASSAGVVKSIESVSAITQQSSSATQQMAANSSEVTKQVEQIAAISQQSAASAEEVTATVQEQNAGVEEMSASSEELAAMAGELQQMVGEFTLGETASGDNLQDVTEKATGRKRKQKKAA